MNQFQQVCEVFERARRIAPAEREAFLQQTCGDNQTLLGEVRDLLRHHDDDSGLLDQWAGRSPLLGLAQLPVTTHTPQRIGKYDIIRKLGEGGMGVVYLAQQQHPRRDVAVKVLRPSLSGQEVLKRFEMEATLLARLQHPGVAQIHDAGIHDNGGTVQPFFAMEYVDGPNLSDFVRKHQPTIRETMSLFRGITEAVHYAHQRGIIHRDLKPSNILVRTPKTQANAEDSSSDQSSSIPVTKILDFGVARATDSDLQATTYLTDVGQLVGTLPYMSPEQVTGRGEDIDIRSDVYALGVILYELLAGRLPFVAESALETMRQVQEDTPSSLSRMDRTIPIDLEAICLKCLEKESPRRYATAMELSDDLQRYLNGEPVTARRLGTVARCWRWCRRQPVLAGMMATIGLLFLAMSIGGSWFGWRESKLRRVAERETTRAEAVTDYLAQTFRSPDPWLEGKDVTVAKALDNAIANLEIDWPEPSAPKATLCSAFAETLLSWGEYDRAVGLAKRAHEIHQQVFGEHQVATSKAATLYADALSGDGRTAEAQSLIDVVYPRLAEALGQVDPATVRAAVVYGKTHVARGDFQRAIRLLETTHRNAAHQRGAFDKQTIMALSALVSARHEKGDVRSLTELLSDQLDRARESLGEKNEIVFGLRGMLAQNLRLAGDLPRAVTLSELNRRCAMEILGEDHPTTLVATNNLATVYADLGRFEKTLELMEQIVDKRREKLGPKHRDTLLAMHNQGMALYNLARDDEALAVLSETLQLSIDALGAKNPRTLETRYGLGSVLWAMQKWDEAIGVLDETWKDMQDVLGRDHPATLEAVVTLGRSYNGAERFEEATRVLESTHATMVDTLGVSNPRTLRCAGSLVSSYRGLGQLSRAVTLQKQNTAAALEQLGPHHSTTCIARMNYGILLSQNMDLDRAERELRELLEALKGTADLDIFQLIKSQTQYTLGEVLTTQERFPESEQMLLDAHRVLDTLPSHQAGMDRHRQRIREDLVRLYEAWDKPEEADQWREEASQFAPEPEEPAAAGS